MLIVDPDEAKKKMKMSMIASPIIVTIFVGIGIGIAFLIHHLGSTDKYEAKLAVAKKSEMCWAYLSAFIFGVAVLLLNFFPSIYKSKIMKIGNMWSNPFIYRLAAGDPAETSAVILHTEGDIGSYNRAHRGLYHFMENVLPVVLALPFIFPIYPFPCFVLTTIYSVGRIVY